MRPGLVYNIGVAGSLGGPFNPFKYIGPNPSKPESILLEERNWYSAVKLGLKSREWSVNLKTIDSIEKCYNPFREGSVVKLKLDSDMEEWYEPVFVIEIQLFKPLNDWAIIGYYLNSSQEHSYNRTIIPFKRIKAFEVL